jgi:hypothetical protein
VRWQTKILPLLILILFSINALSQTGYKLDGIVISADKAKIPNAIIQYDSIVTSSDDEGAFEIEYNGTLVLKISAIGYQALYDTLQIQSDLDIVFMLEKISHEIDQVIIEGRGNRLETSKVINKIESYEIKLIPTAAGVSDVYSTLKTQPGVQSNTEGQKGLVIRGGNYDQSTTYVDGVPVVGSSHLFGLLSMFQTDCIEDVKLYNGYKPVIYGASLGPAIEISLCEEFTQENQNTGSIKSSFLSSQIQTVVSNNNSFIQVGIRNSNLFLIEDLIKNAVNNNDKRVLSPVYSFNDFSFKASYIFKNQTLQFLHLKSFDGVDYDIDFVGEERRYLNTMSWTNEASAVNWNCYTKCGAKIYANLISNTYNSNLYSNNRILFWDDVNSERIWKNSVSTFDNTIDNLKSTFYVEKNIRKEALLKLGLQYKNSNITPNSHEYWEDEPPLEDHAFIGNSKVQTYTGFGEVFGDVFSKSSYIIGFRTSLFRYGEESEIHFNPRFLFTQNLTEKLDLNLYSLMSSQDVHLVTLNSFGFVPELWVAPSEAMPVERSWSTGLKLNYSGEKTAIFIDAYLRGMSNLLEFSENVDFNENTSDIVENGITAHGQGAVVGFEFSIKSKNEKVNYNLSYSYGKSSRLFENLNQGNAFPFAFDIRHDASFVLGYEISDRISISTLYTYSTGRMLNIQNQVIPIGFTTPLGGAYTQWVTYNQPLNRNSYRLGDIHRLDFNISWYKNVSYGKYSVQIGAYNITNHVNPFSAIVTSDEEGSQQIEEVGMMPILPNMTISFSWR